MNLVETWNCAYIELSAEEIFVKRSILKHWIGDERETKCHPADVWLLFKDECTYGENTGWGSFGV